MLASNQKHRHGRFTAINLFAPISRALKQFDSFIGQVRCHPDDVASVPRPDRLEPLLLIPIAAVQQGPQLGQLVLKKVSRVLSRG